jgi:hypothetical protein
MEKMEAQQRNLKLVKASSVKHKSQLEGYHASKVTKSKIAETSQLIADSKEWNKKLVVEVGQLLQLASMEPKASKLQVDCALKEKQKLFDQLRTMQLCMEFVEASLNGRGGENMALRS